MRRNLVITNKYYNNCVHGILFLKRFKICHLLDLTYTCREHCSPETYTFILVEHVKISLENISLRWSKKKIWLKPSGELYTFCLYFDQTYYNGDFSTRCLFFMMSIFNIPSAEDYNTPWTAIILVDEYCLHSWAFVK